LLFNCQSSTFSSSLSSASSLSTLASVSALLLLVYDLETPFLPDTHSLSPSSLLFPAWGVVFLLVGTVVHVFENVYGFSQGQGGFVLLPSFDRNPCPCFHLSCPARSSLHHQNRPHHRFPGSSDRLGIQRYRSRAMVPTSYRSRSWQGEAGSEVVQLVHWGYPLRYRRFRFRLYVLVLLVSSLCRHPSLMSESSCLVFAFDRDCSTLCSLDRPMYLHHHPQHRNLQHLPCYLYVRSCLAASKEQKLTQFPFSRQLPRRCVRPILE
jgi:hypothetical protein